MRTLRERRPPILHRNDRLLRLSVVDKARLSPVNCQFADRHLLALDHKYGLLDLACGAVIASCVRELVPPVAVNRPRLHPFASQSGEDRRAVLRDGDSRLLIPVPEVREGQLLRPRRHAVAGPTIQSKTSCCS